MEKQNKSCISCARKAAAVAGEKSDKVQCNVNLWWIDDFFVDTNQQSSQTELSSASWVSKKFPWFTNARAFWCSGKTFGIRASLALKPLMQWPVSQVRFQHESPRSPITKITINRRRNVTNQTAIYYCCSEELNELKMCVSSMQYSRPKWGKS